MKLFNDPKVKIISLDDFIRCTDSFYEERTIPDGDYYYITNSFCIIEVYKCVSIDFGEDYEERFDYFILASRDGITEYKAIEEKLKVLEEQVRKHPRTERYKKYLKKYRKCIKKFPPYKPYEKAKSKDCFKDSLVKVEYKPVIDDASNYVVLDVETNGLRKKQDDLLSITIYDPSLGESYNRYLPLDLQPAVKTTSINGITTEGLSNQYHLTQGEVDKILDYFDLNHKTVLVYSGNNNFDYLFISNYLKRHGLNGFENLKIDNIKHYVPSGAFGLAGSHSKDSLCELFGIEGVSEMHSGLNDCLLEWKLFEKFVEYKPIEINGKFYKFNKDYIIPVTVLCNNTELFEYAKINFKYILGTASRVYQHVISEDPSNSIKKFDTNFTGISLENVIYSSLNVQPQNNMDFLINNKKKLEEIGKLESNYHIVGINVNNDGTLKALNKEDVKFIDEVNESAMAFRKEISPVVSFIKHKIFHDGIIRSQELVLSEDKKVLALCDLSNETTILEIKTYRPGRTPLNYLLWDFTYQLYYEAKGRDVYYMVIDFGYAYHTDIVASKNTVCAIEIYKVDIKELSKEDYKKAVSEPSQLEKAVLSFLRENPHARNEDILKKFPVISKRSLSRRIKDLIHKGLVEKEGTRFDYYWIVKYSE